MNGTFANGGAGFGLSSATLYEFRLVGRWVLIKPTLCRVGMTLIQTIHYTLGAKINSQIFNCAIACVSSPGRQPTMMTFDS